LALGGEVHDLIGSLLAIGGRGFDGRDGDILRERGGGQRYGREGGREGLTSISE
jgi:hypothetical protein